MYQSPRRYVMKAEDDWDVFRWSDRWTFFDNVGRSEVESAYRDASEVYVRHVEACPVYLKSNKTYVPPRVEGTAEAKLRKLLDGLDSLGIQLVNSGYDDKVVEAISEYIESLRREVKSA